MKLTTTLTFLLVMTSLAFAGKIEAEKGVIDLSSWDPSKEQIINLSGEWEFYWNQLLVPGEDNFENPAYRSGHSSWNSHEENGKAVGGFGYGTYRVNIINIPEVNYGLLVRNVTCAARVYVNGELVTEVGKVGKDKESMDARYENRIVSLAQGQDSLELVVHISNFYHRNGGMSHPFKFGDEDALYSKQREQIMLDGMISSCYLFAGIFFLTLWIFRKKNLSLLFMSLFCLTVFPRALTSNYYMINTIFPNLNWHIMAHVEYLSMFLPTGFIMLFIRERFPLHAPRKLLTYLAYFMFAEAIFALVTPLSIFSWTAFSHQFISIISFLLIFYVIIRAFKDRYNGAFFGGTAIMCLIAWAILIILRWGDNIEPVPYLMTILQIGFLLSMSLILGARFASNFTKVEKLQETTEQQRDELEVQKHIVEAKNEEILSSIAYAKRIQEAILPSDDFISNRKPDSFILYIPKDIVAGDFYWADEVDGKLFFAAADCTGHGVPGAMVSVVCHSALNRSLREFGLTDPGKLLDKTRELVLETFETETKDVKDGMDIALCVLDLNTNELWFSGANNPLCVVPKESESLASTNYDRKLENEDRVLYEFKSNKQPVGVHPKPEPFYTHKLQLNKGDIIYLFTDGYPDQFGGKTSKKMMYKPFKKHLLANSQLGFNQQANLLHSTFDNWKGDFDQTDDVCIIGLKI